MAKYLTHLSFTSTTTTLASTYVHHRSPDDSNPSSPRHWQAPAAQAYCGTSLRIYCGDSPTTSATYMGFDAVWILPVVKNVDGHHVRRWLPRASTIPSSPLLCPHFGPSTELKNLSEVFLLCGMYFMA
ncbi:hypothetical protein DFH08DRAFT_969298 [Mycena albidolilacea]|uniref:Uncharacterized protein n=1 Tax=Mycena albidolilacea TaxID=1033008 RepID=A0AAD6ZI23_9AGAR|nr:hypothetical protein DFH08DRAFT_969298 [Mycena albidolilacea]